MNPETPTPDELREQIEELRRAVASHHLVLSDDACRRLWIFARELVAHNERYNLMSRKDVHNVVRKHIALSLSPFVDRRTAMIDSSEPDESKEWTDIGTGGGFPGLVIKAVSPRCSVTLVEPSGKRCTFLERAAARMGVDVPIVQKRAETYLKSDGVTESFRVVLTRAVTALDAALRLFGPLVAPGGTFVTFKGPEWNDEVCRALHTPGAPTLPAFRLVRVLQVPWAPGHVLWFAKE